MEVFSECPQRSFLLGAEAMLFVDNKQSHILELDSLARERLGADDQLDFSIGKPGLHFA
jgi:hypothetical protein